MFKYSAINSYSLRNLHQNQIYFNSPQNFNDPFDTFHPAEIRDISDKKIIELYCKFKNSQYDEKTLERILNKKVSKKEFIQFCERNIDFFISYKNQTQEEIESLRKNFIQFLKLEISKSQDHFNANRDQLIEVFKKRIQLTIKKSIEVIREERFKVIGITCFSKNNDNLLMWSHYADSHKGFCLEFDSKHEPFSKAFEVTYQTDIPEVNTDLLFNEYENEEAIKKLLSFKSKEWEHEGELRIFHQESNKSYRYDANLLKAIYFGLRANQSEIEIICSVVKAHNPNVRFYRMKRLPNKFGLVPEGINYQTPVELKKIILKTITDIFDKEVFSMDELFINLKLNIEKRNLQLYLNKLIEEGKLIKKENNFKLSE